MAKGFLIYFALCVKNNYVSNGSLRKIKVMKREAWASPTTVVSSFACWLCPMLASRHSCEEPEVDALGKEIHLRTEVEENSKPEL